MKTKTKFANQQILTGLGLVAVLLTFVDALISHSWTWFLLSIIYSNVIVSLFATQIILHRYYSHKSFVVNVIWEKLFAIVSILAGQGSPIAWSSAHRHHHKHSDQVLDNHSPRESYLLAAGAWLLKGYEWVVVEKKLKTIPVDLIRNKNLTLLEQYYYYIWWMLAIVVGLINYKFMFYFLLAPVGWNLVFAAMVTLGCHIKLPGSYKNFNLSDDTHNNLFIQAIVLGDGLHNNHHARPNDYNTSFEKYEFDLASKIINLIKKTK